MFDLTKQLINGLRQGIPYTEIVPLVRDILTHLQEAPTSFTGTWHPYGFLVVKLGVLEKSSCLRLHIWPMQKQARQVPDWPVHNHYWFLHSWVLCGNLTNELYEIEQNALNASRRLYQVRYVNNLSILEATNIPVSCNMISQTDYKAKQDYCVATGQYHITNAREGVFTSTIVLITDQVSDLPKVVGEFGCDDTYPYERRTCDSLTFNSLIRNLKEKLGNIE